MRDKTLILSAILFLLSGCPNEVGGPFATFGTGGGGGDEVGATSGGNSASGADETHGFTADPDECVAKACSTPADCCEGVQPSLPTACPSGVYPNNWSCVSSECVNAGCANDTDCIVPDLSCHQVGGVGACVPVCDDDLDCTEHDDPDDDNLAHALPGTTCSGTVDGGGTNYCVQPLP